MTPDDMARALAYQQDLAQALSVAVGREMNAYLGRNMKLDHPDVAYLTHVRAHLDQAGTELAQALIHAREPHVAARIVEAERGECHERQRQQEKAETDADADAPPLGILPELSQTRIRLTRLPHRAATDVLPGDGPTGRSSVSAGGMPNPARW